MSSGKRAPFFAPLLGILLAGTVFAARSGFKAPTLSGPVVDEVSLLKEEHYRTLDQTLRSLSNEGQVQVVVHVTRSLQGLEIEEFGIELAEAWKVGHQDRGVIFIIAPNEKKMRIEVGYGLEGVLTDVLSSEILRTVVKPQFQSGRFSEGIFLGTQAILDTLRGESFEGRRPRGALHLGNLARHFNLLVVFGLLLFVLPRLFTRWSVAIPVGLLIGWLGSSLIAAFVAVLLLWTLGHLLSAFQSSPGFRSYRRSGGWSGGSGWGGGSGGGWGGGFGGGGGSFGGGGASSGW